METIPKSCLLCISLDFVFDPAPPSLALCQHVMRRGRSAIGIEGRTRISLEHNFPLSQTQGVCYPKAKVKKRHQTVKRSPQHWNSVAGNGWKHSAAYLIAIFLFGARAAVPTPWAHLRATNQSVQMAPPLPSSYLYHFLIGTGRGD